MKLDIPKLLRKSNYYFQSSMYNENIFIEREKVKR